MWVLIFSTHLPLGSYTSKWVLYSLETIFSATRKFLDTISPCLHILFGTGRLDGTGHWIEWSVFKPWLGWLSVKIVFLDYVLYSLTDPFSIQEYLNGYWGIYLMPGVTLWRTSIPSSGEYEFCWSLHAMGTRDNRRPDGLLGWIIDFIFHVHTVHFSPQFTCYISYILIVIFLHFVPFYLQSKDMSRTRQVSCIKLYGCT